MAGNRVVADRESERHRWNFVGDVAGSAFGYDQFIKSATAQALTAFDILTDQSLSLNAWDEHRSWSSRDER